MCIRDRVEVHNVELRRLPDDVLAALKIISEEVIAEIPGDDPLAQKIYKSYIEYRDSIESYQDISERAYINARAAD